MVYFYYFPLGGSGCLDSGFPQHEGFVGGYFLLVSGRYCFNFFLSSWNYLVDELYFSSSTIQKHEPFEWERVEKNLRRHVVVLVEEQPTREDWEMENMDFFVEKIHMVYVNLKYFHHYWGYIQGLGVDPYFIERPDASRVPVGVLPMTEGEQ
jgi:hypothetical protein